MSNLTKNNQKLLSLRCMVTTLGGGVTGRNTSNYVLRGHARASKLTHLRSDRLCIGLRTKL